MSNQRPDLQLELPLAGTSRAAAGGQFSLPLDDPPLTFRLRRSRRSGVTLAADELGLQVNAPRGMALPQIEQAIRQGSRALADRRVSREAGPGKLPRPTQWRDGARFPFLGREVVLRLVAQSDQAGLRDEALYLPLPGDASERQIKDRTEGWLQGEAQRTLAAALARGACELGMPLPAWRLSFAAGTWGGIDAAGRLRLSWRLIHLSPEEIGRLLVQQLQPLRGRAKAGELWETDAAPVPA